MKTIEQYILETDNKSAGIVGFLRQLILSCSTSITEKVSYGVPFYYYSGRLCYIHAVKNGVELAFCNGSKISDPFKLLSRSENREVKTITFKDIKDVDYDKVIPLLQQALLINEMHAIEAPQRIPTQNTEKQPVERR